MSCIDCTCLIPFAENQGLKEVPGDGMCSRGDMSKPEKWILVCNDHHCMNFNGKNQESTMLVPQGAGLRILEKAKAITPLPSLVHVPTSGARVVPKMGGSLAKGRCGECASWRRQLFTESGQCWNNERDPGSRQCITTNSTDFCQHFHPQPANNGKAGDIVDIIMGEQQQIVFVGNEIIVSRGKDGKEHVFNKKGFKFRKC